MVVGWSLPEKYVHDKLSYIMSKISAKIEQLSIIDPYYQTGHDTIANRYNLNQDNTHFAVAPTQADLTTDNLFLALQTKYSLKQLLNNTDEQVTSGIQFKMFLMQCDLGNAKNELSWADDFLPAWIRLCWRTGHLKVRTFNPFDIRLEKQDVHIPYQGIETTRIDMEMAATIFLSHSKFTNRLGFLNISRRTGPSAIKRSSASMTCAPPAPPGCCWASAWGCTDRKHDQRPPGR